MDKMKMQDAQLMQTTVFYGPLYPRNVHIQSQGVQYYKKINY